MLDLSRLPGVLCVFWSARWMRSINRGRLKGCCWCEHQIFLALWLLQCCWFSFLTCSACDWCNALYQPFHTPGQTGFFLGEKKYWHEGWSSALNCVNACLQKYHLSWVQGSCNSINGLCWWQKPQQESSSVTRALTWKYNCNSCRFAESSFNINVEHAWYYWNAFEALKTRSICRLRLGSQRKQSDLLLWPLTAVVSWISPTYSWMQ